jgi:hypothetical protein
MNHSLKYADPGAMQPGDSKTGGTGQPKTGLLKLVFLFFLASGLGFGSAFAGGSDTIPPVIKLSSPDTITIAVTATPKHPVPIPKVISAIDLVDGNLAGSVVIDSGKVKTNILGIYKVTYTVSDLSGNKAVAYGYVTVIDTIAPVMKLVGKSPEYLEIYTQYTERGITATDNYYTTAQLSPRLNISSDVDTSSLGTYQVTYKLTDPSGNHAVTIVRTVIVIDTISPKITLNGPQTDSVAVFDPYNDPGVTYSDNYDKKSDLTLTVTGTFYSKFPGGKNTNFIGTYTIIYTVTDKSNNKSTVIRDVKVQDRTAPVITLKGSMAVSVCQYGNYVDSGYTIYDNYSKTIAASSVTVEGTFLTHGDSLPGLYYIRFKAVDASGNVGYSAYRYILVKPTTDLSCGTSMITNFDTTMCKNSCADITAQYAGKAYKWSTGSTTRTIHFCPTHDSVLTVAVTASSGKTISFIYYVTVTQTTCVWPGDADNDMKADKNDLLAIGIAYGDSDVKRPSASINWTGQPSNDWKKSFKSGENYKYADCNGDGKVDSLDMAAITKNYGKTHAKASSPNGGSSDPPLYSKFSRDSAVAGDTVSVTLSLGNSTIPANNVYGVKFSVNYSSKYIKVGKTLPDFSKCWIGTPGKDMIYLVHNDSENGVLDVAVTRIDHKSVSGYGTIGTVGLVMQDNLGGKRWIDRTVYFNIADVKMITENEVDLPVNAQPDSVRAYKDRSAIALATRETFYVSLYPNPVSHNFRIDACALAITEIRIINILGSDVYTNKTVAASKIDIPASQLSPGIYSVIIITKNGSVVKHFVKE